MQAPPSAENFVILSGQIIKMTYPTTGRRYW